MPRFKHIPIELQPMKAIVIDDEHHARLKLQEEAALHKLRFAPPSGRLAIPTLEGVFYLPYSDIVYVRSESNYSNIVPEAPRSTLLVSKSLSHFEPDLVQQGFMRVHRSYIVNLRKVEAYLKANRGFLRMTDGAEIPNSSRYKPLFLKAMEHL